MNGIAQTCFSGRAKGKFLIQGELPFNSKPRALVGFELRTEPELSTGDSHSTSAPHTTPICVLLLYSGMEPTEFGLPIAVLNFTSSDACSTFHGTGSMCNDAL